MVRVFQVPSATERLAAVAALEVAVPPEAPVEAEVDAEAVPLFWRVDLPEAQGGAGGCRGARHCDHCHIATWVYLQKRSDHDLPNQGTLAVCRKVELGLVKFGMKIYIMNHYDMGPYGSVVHSVHLQSRGEGRARVPKGRTLT